MSEDEMKSSDVGTDETKPEATAPRPWEKAAQLARLRRLIREEREAQRRAEAGEDVPPAAEDEAASEAPAARGSVPEFEADGPESGFSADYVKTPPLTDRLRLAGRRLARFVSERRRRRSLSEVADQKKERQGQVVRFVVVVAVLSVTVYLVTLACQRTFHPQKPAVRTFVSDWQAAPANVDKESFQTQYEGRLDVLTDKVATLAGTLADLDARLVRMKNEAAKETSRQRAAREGDEAEAVEREALLKAPPAGVVAAGGLSAEDAKKLVAAKKDVKPRLMRVTLAEGTAEAREGTVAVYEHPIGGRLKGLSRETPLARNRAQGAAPRTYLPAGTFMKSVVLSGVTASTGGTAAANPVPLLLEVTDFAHLPNDFRGEVAQCFITASATGDLSSERVLVRLDRLSCMKKDGRAVDVRVQGYVTGEDGKTGVRGRLVSRSGQAIANAVFLGTLSGLGEAVSLSAQNTTTYAAGGSSRTVANPWKAGLGEGMSDAMDRIVDYYLRLADKIFPVLELDGGRRVEVVLSQGVTIAEKEDRGEKPESVEGDAREDDAYRITKTMTQHRALRGERP